jgi:hypothetical protein
VDPAAPFDRLELRDLVDAYARAADRRDRVAFESLFLPDATLTVVRPDADPHTYEGASAIGEIVPNLGRYTRTFHLVANHWCSVRGSRATGETYCQAHHVHGVESPMDLVLNIRYLDAYARGHDGWHFASREVQILWTSELPLTSGPLPT